jgi:hypothetical protein
VAAADVAWIPKIPAELVHLILIHIGHGNELDENELRMALIADVYTNAEKRQVLETGTGIPYRIYVPLNDGQGGKRIAVGYTFRYYEFTQPQNDRLTDEKWKAQVYAPGVNLTGWEPEWARDIALAPGIDKP